MNSSSIHSGRTSAWRRLVLAAALMGASASACGDDGGKAGDEENESASGESGDEDAQSGSENGDNEDPSASGEGPLYLIASYFSAGDEGETYLATAHSFDEETSFDPTDGPKLVGGISPQVHGGAVFAPNSNSPVLYRFEINEDDKLEQTDELTFSGVGLAELASWHVWVVSDTKGYVFDPAGPRIIVWDPSDMTLTGDEIDLSDVSREGWVPNLVFEHSGPVKRGEQLLVPLSWLDQDENSRFAAAVLVLDTETDSVVNVAEDERCGESYASIEAPNGDAYFFPPDWSADPHFFYEEHGPTCILRIKAGETQFDPEYSLDLSALGTGSAAAGAVPDGKTGFFFQAVDEELWDEGNNETKEYWQVWHYDFETEESKQIDSMPIWAGHLYYVNVGGDPYIPYWRETDMGATTTIYSVDGGQDPKELFSFDASWYVLAQLR